ncbi:MAG: hypothetical protein J6A79_17170 [Clostridia bacterium]|nr:hypothetical protein [Clostridia bacterium]
MIRRESVPIKKRLTAILMTIAILLNLSAASAHEDFCDIVLRTFRI